MPSSSAFLRIRGLRYHLRRWGDPRLPPALLGHGLLDASASFEALVQPLLAHRQILAPDWRGLGYTEWPADGYWFPDYVADLDALVEQLFAAGERIELIGHSMGGQILSLYAGLRPERVRKLVLLDSLLLPDMPAELAPDRYRRWLDELRQPLVAKTYPSFAALAERIRRQHPQLDAGRALNVAKAWAAVDGHGRIRLLADPRHRLPMPGLFRLSEAMAIWRNVQAPTLFIDGGRSPMHAWLDSADRAQRLACFREHRVECLADAGHMLHFEAPQQTADLILRFLLS